jgi:hypothetical protein
MEDDIRAQAATRYYWWEWQRFLVCCSHFAFWNRLTVGVVHPATNRTRVAKLAANLDRGATSNYGSSQRGAEVREDF